MELGVPNWNSIIFYFTLNLIFNIHNVSLISAALSNKIYLALDSSNLGTSKEEEIAVRNIRNQLVKYVSLVLKSLRDLPDNIEEYRALYGSLGPYLRQGVVRARQQSGGWSGSSSSADIK